MGLEGSAQNPFEHIAFTRALSKCAANKREQAQNNDSQRDKDERHSHAQIAEFIHNR